jgi:outer membrane protein assembly factor BamA
MRLSILTLILFSSIAGEAQLSSTPPQAFYDGQTVTAVDLIADPHRDVDSLRPLIAQKPGQPYSQAEVQASISALQRSAGVEKVTVNVIPDISGLRLDFILEPAYYLGMVDFQGIAASFSYTRLLQVVDLQEEDPYDQARIPIAEAALVHFLERNGFFQAKAHADLQIDDANQLVNITFSVQPGKQARIGIVEVHGTSPAVYWWSAQAWQTLYAGANQSGHFNHQALFGTPTPAGEQGSRGATAIPRRHQSCGCVVQR